MAVKVRKETQPRLPAVPRPAARTIIEPILSRFLRAYPAVTLEVVIDSALTDIVRDRFDAGIRPGHRVEQDMIALRLGEDAEPTVVASIAKEEAWARESVRYLRQFIPD